MRSKSGEAIYLNWLLHQARRRIVRAICGKLYRDENRNLGNSVFIAGAARSGTTWLAEIIASQGSTRIMFEPFHSRLVAAFGQYSYFQYMRPSEENDRLLDYARSVLTGEIRDPWIDRHVETLRPCYRVIKEIRANLFLKWLHDRFPEVPILFLVRHPCAVVLSRMKLGWATDGDILPFLDQPDLVDDFLGDKLDVVQRAATLAEKHAVIWCISNLVPISQFGPGTLPLVFYEDLCLQPEHEIPRIFELIGRKYDGSTLGSINRPSITSRAFSAVVAAKDRVSGWRNELSSKQIDDVLALVEAFDLSSLYGSRLA